MYTKTGTIEDCYLRDDSVTEAPIKLSKEELRDFSRISAARASFHIISEWLSILAAICLVERFWNPWLYIAAVVFIGSRQHALMILMHDGVHRRLFADRRINDWVSEIVLAWPNLISARAYRRNHFAHHRFLNTPQDPDWARRQGDPAWLFPKKTSELTKLLARDISGLNALRLLALARSLMSTDSGVSKEFLVARYGFYLVILAALIWMHAAGLLLIYWFVPLFTWLIFIFRIRSIAEHSALEVSGPAYAGTRTTVLNVLERILIAPKNVSYHLEHHLFPSVPFYRLPELHRLLFSKQGFSESAKITRGYLGVLHESIGRERTPKSMTEGIEAFALDTALSASLQSDFELSHETNCGIAQ